MSPANPPMETFLYQMFEENFEMMYAEVGYGITPDVKKAALEQVLLYWRKLRSVAENVSETEIKLTLPHQESPGGRRYTLEGMVDIVRDDDETIMYDIKTYLDSDAARAALDPHYRQLNVYAHIWRELRGQPLDKTAVIATKPTYRLRRALDDIGDLDEALEAWDPVLDIELDAGEVDATIEDFGRVVDAIESSDFFPPPAERLQEPTQPGGKRLFGSDVCINCDVRFSCSSYKQFAQRSSPNRRPEQVMQRYFNQYSPSGEEQERWVDANLESVREDGSEDF